MRFLSFFQATYQQIGMSVGCLCSHCDAADCNRRKNDKIRCTKYSQWVNPNDIGCDAYACSEPLGMKKHTTSQQRLQRLQQSKATS